MDMLKALENMAQTSATANTYADVDRWMQLFGYTAEQAEEAIETHFQNLSHITISDDHWGLVRDTMEAQGHDQESYAHYITHFASSPSIQQHLCPTNSSTKKKHAEEYLIGLVRGLNAVDIQTIAGLSQPLKIVRNDTGNKDFAVVDAATVAALRRALPGLVFVPLPGSAIKDLSDISIAPTLGVDATLPQRRISNVPSPRQNEHPVSYFFYGTLADPDRLSRLLDLDCEPSLSAATISRGSKKKWGRYYALVDGLEQDSVQGWLYKVANKEHEDELRRYESSNYEVVRCEIEAGGEVISGLTFRCCGDEKELS
ncbi:uncharacterized protein N0V89_011610 [Didymosphaeria variabile]|uniref:Putative gamma-glutamylcyclotransferase n=1 Tax=Didymosphaeria variabile TaxID=1932322 RepID=A0A9W8XBM0_9PLEO|nr:uncharacterized protein N0V89_011610 [Didymosphaeria variabile]KAJ4345478.1 hypothetical protein N0V89_011610 [Didymosphaeria variabile]